MQMSLKFDFFKKWLLQFKNIIFSGSQTCQMLILTFLHCISYFLKNQILSSFAYCGLAFLAYNAPIFSSRWKKFKPDMFFTQIHCLKCLVVDILRNLTDFLIFGPFKAIFGPLRHIVQYYKLTQISIATRILCFLKKKFEILYTSTVFIAKIAIFSSKNRF